ncbi:MAG TPA: hypothetical protein VFK20_07440 [Vicinamibacterales bacterium]|nr:hypothetical protein [Vicinamibacterales bacterium]
MIAGLVLVAMVSGGGADAAARQAHEHPGSDAVDFPISCSAAAQAEFNRGVALLHHMTYPRARESFERVAALDARCAMAHWGIAMTLFQPLWPTRPGPDALRRGWEAVQQARALELPTARERLLVDAAAAFFRDPASADYWARIRGWAAAMAKAHETFPKDDEISAFDALAILASAPPESAADASARAAALLYPIYERHPDHPGALHYLVHANDTHGREHELPDVVRKYETIAPRNPHALHMPTHIYTRLGEWDAVIRGNLLAADAALEQPAGDRGQYVWDEFPHAIEYLVYAYLQEGDDARAAAQLKRLHETARLEPTLKTAFHLASTSARYALERRAWREASQLTPREPASLSWDQFPWPEAVTWFARALGAVHEGQMENARRAIDRLQALEDRAAGAGEDVFTRNIRVLRLEASAWADHAAGRAASAVALMRQAAALEASTPKPPVTPGPTLPAEELLGDLFMEHKQPAEALAAYTRSLEQYPKRFNSLLGAARAARASNDAATARRFYQELLETAVNGTRQAPLDEARAFLSAAR